MEKKLCSENDCYKETELEVNSKKEQMSYLSPYFLAFVRLLYYNISINSLIKKTMSKVKCMRHGEIVFEVIDKLPEDFKSVKTKTIIKGKSGNNHDFKGGEIFFKNENDFVFGYFKAENTKLYHPDHGEKKQGNLLVAELPDGNYRLRKQQEFINGELRPVID